MFRQPLRPCVCLVAALGLAVAVVPAAAWSQERTTQERLDRLERDLNMLQRQVYRGAPPGMTGGGNTAAVNVEVRMERLEAQMRDLTGRVEEIMNRVEQVRQRVEQINGDVDMRLGQSTGIAEGGPAGRPVAADGARGFPPGVAGSPDEVGPPPDARLGSLAPPGGSEPPPGDGPAPIFGTLTPPGTASGAPPRAPSAPAGLASTAPAAHPPAHGTLPAGSPAEQYNHAFGLLKKADYTGAETALKSFVAQHPRDRLAGNAQYWLGETYYARGKYVEAASAFAEGYRRYPKSSKAADDLLKLGMSLSRANQKQNACLALNQLDHDFPHAGASVKGRAVAEKKRLGC